MLRSLILILTLSALPFLGSSQNVKYQQSTQEQLVNDSLSSLFTSFKLIHFDAQKYYKNLKNFDNAQDIIITIDENEVWPVQIWPDHRMIEDMKVHLASNNKTNNLQIPLTYKGSLQDNPSNRIRITLRENYFSAYLILNKGARYIEPVSSLIPGFDDNLYVVYNSVDVIASKKNGCIALEVEEKMQTTTPNEKSQAGNCFELELSIASDFLMFDKYNTESALIAHNVTVMNNVQNNYDDEFDDEIQFVIVEQWISDCSTCDPWTSSTDAGTLLGSFTNWGPDGFDETHDLGQLWTDRDFDGSTVGIAWLGVVCNNSRYHCLQDFTSNADFLRCMTAHEIGHNFNADHDAAGDPFIMAPSVSNSTIWSSNSENDIQNHINSRNCLAICAPPAPPAADFFANLTDICPGTSIQFFDNSSNNPNSWTWSFPGGSPGSSNQENPVVTYNNPGTYSVTLTVVNPNGSDSEFKSGYISVSSTGTDVVFSDDFESGLGNWTVTNPDNQITWQSQSAPGSSGGNGTAYVDNYDYDNSGQKDGLETPVMDFTGRSNIQIDLEYAYARYNVTHSDIFRVMVSTDGGNSFPNTIFTGKENGGGNWATRPDLTSEFVPANVTEWCIATNFGPNCLSLNLDGFADQSQVVIRLENETDFGNNLYIDNVIITSSCQISNPPDADFTSSNPEGCTPFAITFQDLSENDPTSWNWSFPGGIPSTSSDQHPVILYQTAGIYDVTLVASNSAGSSTITKTAYVEIGEAPVPSFSTQIIGNTVLFTYTGTDNVFFYNWDFGDGSSSSDENPVHAYAQDGTYTVTLTVSNNCGADFISQTINIESMPVADFTADVTDGCVPLEVQFTNQSTDNVTSYLWTFTGATPSSSVQENPSVVYENAGTFDVSLTVTNEFGSDTHTELSYITVDGLPIVDFTVDIDGLAASFMNNSQGADSYLWNFGDGTTSTLGNPIHVYDQGGTYEVTLTATNSCGSNVSTLIIDVTTAPIADISSNITSGCSPLSVQFMDSSSGDVDEWLWVFEGGTPSTSSEENPLVLYSNSGVFDVTLIVTNSEGQDEIYLPDYILVGVDPIADYSFNINEDNVSFINESINADSYHWDFGDGDESTNANPTHSYDTDGTYTVVLTAINGCGTDMISFQVNVVSPVIAGATALNTFGCVPFTVNFINLSSDNVENYLWTFPGGNPSSSTLENPTVVYNTAGTYSVTLQVSNANFDDEIILNNYVVVNDLPDIGFNFDLNDLAVEFENTTVGATSFSWDFGDDTNSSQENPTHIYDQEGEYTVILYASNECGTVSISKTINASALPTANFSFNDTPSCAPHTIQFMDESTSNTTSWLWTFEGGTPSTSNAQNPIITYNSPGVFDVSLTAINSSGEHAAVSMNVVEVLGPPVANFDFQINGATVEFNNLSTNATNYVWEIESIAGSINEENPAVVFEADGTYQVKLTAQNECGMDVKILTVEITGFPNPSISSNEITGCAPFEVQYDDISTDNVITREWIFDGGNPATSTEKSPLVIYNEPGQYDVSLIVTNDVGDASLILNDYITVLDSPNADFEFDVNMNTVSFTGNSGAGATYFWDFGDGNSSDVENPTHVFDSNGDYTVNLTVTIGDCTITISKVIAITIVGVFEENITFSKIYPNPASNVLYIEFDDITNGVCTYQLINVIGEQVLTGSWEVQSNFQRETIPLNYPPGLYLLSIESDAGLQSTKIVIQ